MNKKLLLPVLAVFVIGSVFAIGYIVNSLTLKVDVKEPFSVQYAIIGDAGNWNGDDTCSELPGEAWKNYEGDEIVDVDGLYAGEGRKFCVKITNDAEADITYTIANVVTGQDGTWDDDEEDWACYNAFGQNDLTGTVDSKSSKIDGLGIVVSQSADPVENCLVTVDVSRGTD
jgi:hypothetical protein